MNQPQMLNQMIFAAKHVRFAFGMTPLMVVRAEMVRRGIQHVAIRAMAPPRGLRDNSAALWCACPFVDAEMEGSLVPCPVVFVGEVIAAERAWEYAAMLLSFVCSSGSPPSRLHNPPGGGKGLVVVPLGWA